MPMLKPRALTRSQRAIFEHLRAFQAENGRPPSGPEIARQFGYSDPSSAYQQLRAIAAKGFIQLKEFGRGRQMGICEGPWAKYERFKASLPHMDPEEYEARINEYCEANNL